MGSASTDLCMHPHTGHSRGTHAGQSGRRRRLEGLLGAWHHAIWVLLVINNVTGLQYHGMPISLLLVRLLLWRFQRQHLNSIAFIAVGSCHCLSTAFALKSESSSLESPPSTLHLAPFRIACGPPTSSFHCTTASSSSLATYRERNSIDTP